MNTKKILKLYLVATLSLSSMAALSLNDTFRSYLPDYYTSVLDSGTSETKAYVEANIENPITKSDDLIYRDNPADIMFAISGSAGKSLVTAGTKNAEVMTISFKIGQTDVQLNGIAFKITGATGKDIKNAYLTDGKAIIATASISGNKIKFPNMGYMMDAGSAKNLQLKVDLGDTLNASQVISFEIENSNDINMTVGGGSYSLNGHYPIQGKYLSIAGTR
ncbi:MAG: hypothetical protein NTZ25_01635 [Candidatus Peregrinibacteria bacterium]|nr:hypothetical protein [Candidatus Peregrinibacteria bacterium]